MKETPGWKQRSEAGGYSRGRLSGQWAQHVQRPWGGNVLGIFNEQLRNQCESN